MLMLRGMEGIFHFYRISNVGLRESARDIASVPSHVLARRTNSYKNPLEDCWTVIVVERIAAE